MATYYVMPLGHDYDSKERPTGIGPITRTRCEQALENARKLINDGHNVFIVLPTPALPGATMTMAHMMFDWFINVPRATDMSYVVNRTALEFPHTTYGELSWGLPAAIKHRTQINVRNDARVVNDVSDTTIIIVSNRRHVRRVQWIIRLLLSQYRRGECSNGFVPDTDYTAYYTKPLIRYGISNDQPSSIAHEVLGYCKLLLMWLRVIRS